MDVFYDYLEHKLSKGNHRQFEVHLSDCELCSDALEGFELTPRAKVKEIVLEINTKITLKNNVSKKYIWFAAASILITFGIGVFFFQTEDSQEQLSFKYEDSKVEEKTSDSQITESVLEEEEVLGNSFGKTKEEPLEEKEVQKENIQKERISIKNISQSPISERVEKSLPQEELFFADTENEALKENDELLIAMEEAEMTVPNEAGQISSGFSAPKTKPIIIEKDKETKPIKPQMLAYTEALLYSVNADKIAPSRKKEVKAKRDMIALDQKSMSKANYQTDDFDVGRSYYQKEDFRTALSFFQKAINKEEKAQIYIVLTNVMMDKNEKALLAIEQIIKNKKHPNYYDALWIKVYLLQLENQPFDKELDVLIQVQNPYLEKAEKIKK